MLELLDRGWRSAYPRLLSFDPYRDENACLNLDKPAG
jgi:hypothetical protein